MNTLRILLLCLLAGAWVPASWGHASLVSSSPSDGATLVHGPDAILLHFNEPVSATVLRLINPAGHTSTLQPGKSEDASLRIPVPNPANDGTYLLSWRVVSADGHPVGGTLVYSIGAGSPGDTLASTSATSPILDPDADLRHGLIWLTRWLGYLCLFFAVGAALFRVLNPDFRSHPPAHKLSKTIEKPLARQCIGMAQNYPLLLAGLGLLLLPLSLALQGLDLLAAPWAQSFSVAVWQQALTSPYAVTLGLMALALLLAASTMPMHHRTTLRRAGLACLMLAGAALAVSGHASTAPPQSWSRMAIFLHAVSAIAWIGTLVPLAQALKPNQPLGTSILVNYSRWITWVVATLVLSGAGLAWLQLQRPSDLWQTAYGQVLTAKLALVALLLCVAAINRWKLTKPTLQGQRPARSKLRRSIHLEILLALLILAVVSLWRFTPPPRSLDQATTAAHASHAQSPIPTTTLSIKQVTAQIIPGTPDWHIHLHQTNGQPFMAEALTLLLSNPTAGIETIEVPATRQSSGLWVARPPLLPATGHWLLGTQILVNDFEQINLSD